MSKPLIIITPGLSRETENTLRRNGMHAALAKKDDVYYLAAKNHDTPAIAYAVTPSQLEALTARGSRQADRKAYQTFAKITGRDFRAPSYGDATRNYGRSIYLNPPRGLVMLPEQREEIIWNARQTQDQQVADIRAERRGFYRREELPPPVQDDLMNELEQVVIERQEPITEKAAIIPLNELIASDVSFSNDKWLDSLSSHGVVIDETAKTMTLQAEGQPKVVYDLSEGELKALTAASLTVSTYDNRIQTINAIIADDYKSELTMEMLNERKAIDLTLKEGITRHSEREDPSLREGYKNDNVLEILIKPISKDQESIDAKYKMTAVINGESVTHEINQKELDKFKAMEDYHRVLFFKRIFNEVDKDIDVTTELNKALASIQPGQQAPEIYMSHQEERNPIKQSAESVLDVRAIASKQFELAMDNEQSQNIHLSRS